MLIAAPHRRAVLLDLDGTLVDSAPDLADAANRMLAQLGAPPLPPAMVRSFIGHGVANLVRRVLASAHGLAHVDEASAMAMFERHYAACNGCRSTLYPGVKEGLSMLEWLGYPLACVTNKPRAFSIALLDAMGLSPCFGTLVCGAPGAALKPDPAPLLSACSQMGVHPALAVMVGDSQADAAAAGRAGMPVYLVRYGYHGEAGLAGLRCDGLIDAITELPALLSVSIAGSHQSMSLRHHSLIGSDSPC